MPKDEIWGILDVLFWCYTSYREYFGYKMGNIIRQLFAKKLPKKQCKVVMLGLDGAGKTTILYSLKLGEVYNTIPTIGFNMEELHYKTISFLVWDVGGQ